MDERQALEKLPELLAELTSRFGEPEKGRHRAVFFDGDSVLKVPLSMSGIAACWDEDMHGGNPPHYDPHEWQYARASLEEDLYETWSLPIVRMERVRIEENPEQYEWTRRVDNGQVGWTKDGRLVIYDNDHY